ncbi:MULTISPECIES: DUF4013 domain-containing protein [unclassified Lysobacter]|uniref:DUF4013 domain-containing protein n=1 Tax=unclassified Lysobacter TaxID=2635362 RepID=UPI001BE6BA92|nr:MULTISPECIES: DUF4013 domain-containing protein [unclassified Lysobacter]MBT2748786.1 DUF4013 domain-containing protein [Lysobacter sp. ISL-42]MBT2754332.1 DUF4013 domain-containing protein [Lysobacter sp. ISL-50]MBT2779886.1 DUF4013 domain-containing protein [Lysobacter sp. ISL-54]MBT2783050.1 DUF4013 domain-containing protein [Lysobacter sp. ISL-52]
MQSTSTLAQLVPFWHRLRQIMLYPIRGAAFFTLLVLTLCTFLSVVPGIGWLLSIVTWLAAYKYAFEILRATADGRMDPPESVLKVDGGVVWRLIALQLIYMVVVLVAMLFGGPVVGLFALAVIVFLQPGCIMSLAIDGSLGNALNPATSFGIVARVGWPYLAVFGLLFVIQASVATAGIWMNKFMPMLLGGPLLNLVSFWGLFAAFHLMGYLVYQYHEELGYDPESHRHQLPALSNRDGDLLERAQNLVRDGHNDAAKEILRSEIRVRSVTPEVHELYHRLLRSDGDAAERTEHSRQYLNLLMIEKQETRALTVIREAIEADPQFTLMQMEHAERLAERARMAGQSQLALDLLRSLLRQSPRNPSAPRWALDAALLLVDRFGRDDEARALLEQALTRCEDATLSEKLQAALKPLAPAKV